MQVKCLVLGILAWSAAVLAAVPASAELLATATWVGTLGGSIMTLFPLPLTRNGGTTVVFTTTVRREKVRITYTAQCGIAGNNLVHFNALITVDGNLADPATTDFALCTGVVADYINTGAVRQVIYVASTVGTHRVQVLGAMVGTSNGAGYSIGNSSLVVDH
jgi:hypothetical protein